jgi:hypothetical protein
MSTSEDPDTSTSKNARNEARVQQLHIQLARLIRHYQNAVRHHDILSLLDLTHTLRIWGELKAEVDWIAGVALHTFTWPVVQNSPGMKGVLQGKPFTHFPFAGGMSQPGGLQVLGFSMTVGTTISADEAKKLYEAGPPKTVNAQMSFTNWMGASVVQVPSGESASGEKNHTHLQLSREILIKRIANVMGASHPAGIDKGEGSENKFDAYVAGLHSLIIKNVPATYFQMMEIARQIITTIGELLLRKEEYERVMKAISNPDTDAAV